MPSSSDRHRADHHRRSSRRHGERTPAVTVKQPTDYLLLGLWSALFVLFAIGAVAALMR